jgi:hypothetical protein
VAQLRPEDPVEQKQNAQKERGAGNDCVNRPGKSSPEIHQIEGAQRREHHGANPFPAPGKGQQQQEDGGGDKVHPERERRLPKSVMFIKDVEGEDADEGGEQQAQNSGRPKQQSFYRWFHIVVLEHTPAAAAPLIEYSVRGIDQNDAVADLPGYPRQAGGETRA